MTTLEDRIKGCMAGGAVGDALGYPVEFMSYKSIIKQYGHPGITRYEPNVSGIAEVSDDTQMTLYTAEGLLIGDIEAAYLEWLRTQSYDGRKVELPKCSISNDSRLYSRRAPGGTCLSALNSIAAGRAVCNDSKGCGGIMRVAPIALWGASGGIDIRKSVQTAFDAASMTHKHIHGWLPAGMLVYAIQSIIERGISTREGLIELVSDAAPVYEGLTGKDVDSFRQVTASAIELAWSDVSDEEAIRSLGEGWTGEEAWYISLYCSLRHIDSFEDAVVAAVNHSGDSDSTGAITGNIMGAIHGYSSIPAHYLNSLELLDLIISLSDKILLSAKN